VQWTFEIQSRMTMFVCKHLVQLITTDEDCTYSLTPSIGITSGCSLAVNAACLELPLDFPGVERLDFPGVERLDFPD